MFFHIIFPRFMSPDKHNLSQLKAPSENEASVHYLFAIYRDAISMACFVASRLKLSLLSSA